MLNRSAATLMIVDSKSASSLASRHMRHSVLKPTYGRSYSPVRLEGCFDGAVPPLGSLDGASEHLSRRRLPNFFARDDLERDLCLHALGTAQAGGEHLHGEALREPRSLGAAVTHDGVPQLESDWIRVTVGEAVV